MEKLFKSLIKCGKCFYNYIGFKENSYMKYICNNYKNNKGKCSRRVIDQSDLEFLVKSYCEQNEMQYESTNNFMKSIINYIIIDENGGVEITYKDGHVSKWNNREIII